MGLIDFPGLLKRTGVQNTGVARWMRGNQLTGPDVQYDYPSLPGVTYKGRPVNAAMAFALGDEENEWIFNKVTGGKIPVRRDRDGRPYVTIDGNSGLEASGRALEPGSYYLDRPGLDPQTWKVIGANLGLFATTGGAASLARTGLTRLGMKATQAAFPRIARGAAAGAAGWGAWDAQSQAAQSMLAKQDLMRPGEIADTVMLGGTIGAVGPVLGGASRLYGRRPLLRERWKFPQKRKK